MCFKYMYEKDLALKWPKMIHMSLNQTKPIEIEIYCQAN